MKPLLLVMCSAPAFIMALITRQLYPSKPQCYFSWHIFTHRLVLWHFWPFFIIDPIRATKIIFCIMDVKRLQTISAVTSLCGVNSRLHIRWECRESCFVRQHNPSSSFLFALLLRPSQLLDLKAVLEWKESLFTRKHNSMTTAEAFKAALLFQEKRFRALKANEVSFCKCTDDASVEVKPWAGRWQCSAGGPCARVLCWWSTRGRWFLQQDFCFPQGLPLTPLFMSDDSKQWRRTPLDSQHSCLVTESRSAGPGDGRELVMWPTLLLSEPFLPTLSFIKPSKSLLWW